MRLKVVFSAVMLVTFGLSEAQWVVQKPQPVHQPQPVVQPVQDPKPVVQPVQWPQLVLQPVVRPQPVPRPQPVVLPVQDPKPVVQPVQWPHPVVRPQPVPRPPPVVPPVQDPKPVVQPVQWLLPVVRPQPVPRPPPVVPPVQDPKPVVPPVQWPQPVLQPVVRPQPVPRPQPVVLPVQDPKPVVQPVLPPVVRPQPVPRPQPVVQPVQDPKPVVLPVQWPQPVLPPLVRPQPVPRPQPVVKPVQDPLPQRPKPVVKPPMDAQPPAQKPPPPVRFQSPSNDRDHQVIQGPVKPLNWRFPLAPEVPRPPVVHLDRPDPVSVRSVAALCTETTVHVEVKKDLFGTGEPIDVSALSLGGCGPKGEDPDLQVVVFESELQDCNSNLIMTEDELVYVFFLVYSTSHQTSSGFPVVRSVADEGSTVLIECHYPRLHNVSSNALFPVWIPYASMQVAEELLVFFLRLMMDDWVSERALNYYHLGELINIEASVIQYNHVPLRVYVDSCVATAVPDFNAAPRYAFVTNHGCMVDAKLTGSRSRFMTQTRGDKQGFQLEAFRFQESTSNMLYIACFLRATAASFAPDAEHKACSFINNGWFAAYGNNGVCGCCDGVCGVPTGTTTIRKGRDLHSGQDLQVIRKVTIGPIVVKD